MASAFNGQCSLALGVEPHCSNPRCSQGGCLTDSKCGRAESPSFVAVAEATEESKLGLPVVDEVHGGKKPRVAS